MGETREAIAQLMRRLLALAPGRYLFVLTIGEQGDKVVDWTVMGQGKVEG